MLEIHTFMKELAQKRPIFHSEADFQHAFAWLMHEKYPKAQVRLEYPFVLSSKNIYVDIWVDVGDCCYAVELKYKTNALDTHYEGEIFRLKTHSAADLGRYGFLKDVSRLESMIALSSKPCVGYAVLLANDRIYWSNSGQRRINAKAFETYEERQISGLLSWISKSAQGEPVTLEGDSISLNSSYSIHWNDYSNISQTSNDLFRYVALEIK